MSESKVAPAVAEQEFGRYIEAWDIDDACDTEEDEKAFEANKRRIMKGILAGYVIVDEVGEKITIKTRYPRSVGDDDDIVLDVSKADLLTMDKFKDKQNMHKMNAYIASMAKVQPKVLSGIDPRDYRAIQAIVLLFMG